MAQRKKTLLIIGLFIISMAIVLAVLVLTLPKDEEEEDTDSAQSGLSLLSYSRDDVMEMDIKNELGTFTVRNGVQGFGIDGYSEFRQNSTIMGAMARCAAELTAQELAEENAQDLDKYGLSADNPKARADVKLKDGTEYTLYFGIDAPDQRTRYVRLSDSNDVYTVLMNSSGYFYNDPTDFLSLIVTDELSNNNTAPTIDWMTVTRKDLDYDIRFEDDTKNYAVDEVSMASSQVMIEPVYAYLDITNSNSIIYGIWGLTAIDIACVNPTEEDFEKYGLDDPFCTVNIDAELQNYHLDIGNVAEYEIDETGAETSVPASYYCYYKGIDIIYVFEASEVPWASFMPIDILSSMMTSNYIYKLDHIDIDYYGEDPKSYHFEVSGDEETAEVWGSLNGEEFIGDNFKEIYKFILKCPIDDIYFEDPDESSLLARMDIRRGDGSGDLVEFYDIGANRVAIKLNGVTSFSQPRNYLTVLLKNLELFKNGATGEELQQVW